MKNVLKSLAKSVLISIGLTASAADAAIHKEIFLFGTWTLIIFNEEMNGIMRKVKSLEESGLLKNVSVKKFKMKQKEGFTSMLLGTLGASLLRNLLTGQGAIRAGVGTIRADEDF